MAISNTELWDAIRAKYPTFSSHTAAATADTFTTQGWEALKQSDSTVLNDFFNLSMRVYLQLVNISHAKDNLERGDFGETFDNPLGGYIQRLATSSVKPISPAYKGLQNGTGPDPFVVRKPEVAERFFKQNFDYASLITIQDEFQMKQIFISEYGMSEFMAGIMSGLENGYTVQKYENKLEVLNKAINSTAWPLQSTQQYTWDEAGAEPTADELENLILLIKNIVTAMDIAPQSTAYNAYGYNDTQDTGRLRLLIRPGYANATAVKVLSAAYGPEFLNLPIPSIEVPNFGGLEPYEDAEYSTPLYPVYDSLGAVIGYNTTQGASEATVETADVYWKDPNENVIAVIADKGAIFESRQNGYQVEPIRNPRGLYTNYWASSPNNTIAYDPIYTFVTISKNATA